MWFVAVELGWELPGAMQQPQALWSSHTAVDTRPHADTLAVWEPSPLLEQGVGGGFSEQL